MIKTNRLTKDYGSNRAVDAVSFEVKKGDVLGFLGPNGAGKSTTMKMITGFLPPTSGTATIGDHSILDNPIAAKRLLGYLPESGPLYPEMTAREFLNFIADVRGLEGKERSVALDRAGEVCHLEGVWDQAIDTLSKGYRQRVGMAQALLHDPPCLIMDEPTDGLDPNQKKTVRDLIGSMGQEKAIILSTHILEEVEAMCNRVIIIAKGKIVADETPSDIRRRHPDAGSLRLSVPADRREAIRTAAAGLPEVRAAEIEGDRIILRPQNGKPLQGAIWQVAREKQWPVEELEPVPLKLEVVFRELTLGGEPETTPEPEAAPSKEVSS